MTKRSRIVALGDSVTRGYDGCSDIEKNYPNYLSQILKTPVDNLGINGGTIYDDLVTEVNQVKWEKYDQCILMMGTNDYGHNHHSLHDVIEQLQNNLNSILAKNNQLKIWAILPLNRYDNHQNAADKIRFADYTFNQLLNGLKKCYQDNNISVLDWRNYNPNFINNNNYQTQYNDHHVHPTAATYQQLAHEIANFIKKQ
ncbi:SGNH/GDSL hydrolase family protein [Apilactobacillus apisilvae]|uniref:SGNH/GDSL hydrolase family protein n=1 Tax=Apilactobacillus apisilvae TaxID=2923364 RepID=A0ABY4PHM6_9LACO|nr:SGNH/GDSL hydrolase family protein [Apilactobacillus apisilvae]UQS84954.1 SGNH/GDSL hydrolase family protein [Apilactobacillus apisilvae]